MVHYRSEATPIPGWTHIYSGVFCWCIVPNDSMTVLVVKTSKSTKAVATRAIDFGALTNETLTVTPLPYPAYSLRTSIHLVNATSEM